MNYLSVNLIYLRRKRNLKQGDMVLHVGSSRTTWSNYENRITEPSVDILIRIARYFGVTLDDLLTIDLEEQEIRKEEELKEAKIQQKAQSKQRGSELRLEPLNQIMHQLRELSKDIRVLKDRVDTT